ncbi:MAG TPA: cytochrome P450 [Pseudonocardiaceae bacterium]|jgi:cytochrome P450
MIEPPATAAADPADAMFAWLRWKLDTQPVAMDDNQAWQVFGYAEVARILSDPATFSSDTRAFSLPQADLDLVFEGFLMMMDPPRHRALRTLVTQVFTPRLMAALAPRITEFTASLLSSLDTADRFDLIDSLAFPLPVGVIMELLGVPAGDQHQFRSWVESLLDQQPVNADTALFPAQDESVVNGMAPTMREVGGYLLEHIRYRRRQQTEDLIGRLTTAEIDGERLSDGEIMGVAFQLLLAGPGLTTALIGNAALSFDRCPQAATAVRARRDLLPPAIEEVLRFRPPVPRMGRVATADVELGGQVIQAGQLVICWLVAANRDAAQFPEPDRFDIHRRSTGHLAFGHGIHFCVGALLSRLMAKIALNALLDRYHDIAVDAAGPTEFHNPYVLVSLKRLPLMAS